MICGLIRWQTMNGVLQSWSGTTRNWRLMNLIYVALGPAGVGAQTSTGIRVDAQFRPHCELVVGRGHRWAAGSGAHCVYLVTLVGLHRWAFE
jgi:hypothetical protein